MSVELRPMDLPEPEYDEEKLEVEARQLRRGDQLLGTDLVVSRTEHRDKTVRVEFEGEERGRNPKVDDKVWVLRRVPTAAYRRARDVANAHNECVKKVLGAEAAKAQLIKDFAEGINEKWAEAIAEHVQWHAESAIKTEVEVAFWLRVGRIVEKMNEGDERSLLEVVRDAADRELDDLMRGCNDSSSGRFHRAVARVQHEAGLRLFGPSHGFDTLWNVRNALRADG